MRRSWRLHGRRPTLRKKCEGWGTRAVPTADAWKVQPGVAVPPGARWAARREEKPQGPADFCFDVRFRAGRRATWATRRTANSKANQKQIPHPHSRNARLPPQHTQDRRVLGAPALGLIV